MVFGKDKSNSGKPLKIAGNKPITEAFLNNFFKVFSAEQMYSFEKLYNELEPKLKFINIDGEAFMTQIRDAYKRYQDYKNLDSFTPMDKKGMKYVIQFIRKAVDQTYDGIKKGEHPNTRSWF